MARYDPNTGGWYASDGTWYRTQQDAERYESGSYVQQSTGPSSAEFGASIAGGPTAPPPPPPGAKQEPIKVIDGQGAEDYFANNRRAHFAQTAQMARDNSAEQRAAFADGRLSGVDNGGWWNDYVVPVIGAGVGAGLGTALGGNPVTGALLTSKLERGMKSDRDASNQAYRESVRQDVARSSGVTGTGAGLNGPSVQQLRESSGGEGQVDQFIQDEQDRLGDVQENAPDFANYLAGLSQEVDQGLDAAEQARVQQQQAFNNQQALFDRALEFSPEDYAAMFSEEALANQLAIARSAPGGAGAREAALFNALESAPEIQAEAQRQAIGVENQRLAQAQQAATGQGNIATGIRGQDITTSQLEFDTGLQVASFLQDNYEWASEFTAQERQALGKLMVEAANLDVDWARLTVQQQAQALQHAAAMAGVDVQLSELQRRNNKDDQAFWGSLVEFGGNALKSYYAGQAAS